MPAYAQWILVVVLALLLVGGTLGAMLIATAFKGQR